MTGGAGLWPFRAVSLTQGLEHILEKESEGVALGHALGEDGLEVVKTEVFCLVEDSVEILCGGREKMLK